MRYAALPLIFAAVVVVSAQAEKPPFEWKVSGDSVENFRMELVANHKADQSSARATVLTYAAFTDNRESTAAMMKDVGSKWEAAVKKSLLKHEQELLTTEAIKAMNAVVAEAGLERTLHATKVTAEKAEKDVTWVETTQAIDVPYKELGTGKVLSQKQELKLRFACVKAGDKWRIRGIEQQVVDEEGTPKDGKAPTKWVEDPGLLPVIMYAVKQDANRAQVPDAKRDTPEGAAKSLFESLIARRDLLTESVRAKGLSGWLDVLKPLFTDDFLKAQDDRAAEWIKQKTPEAAREVEKVSENADGTNTVRFKPIDQYSGSVEVHLSRDGKNWKVASAGFYQAGRDSVERPVWKYVPEPNLYNLKWR
jgi:hypothetical protein